MQDHTGNLTETCKSQKIQWKSQKEKHGNKQQILLVDLKQLKKESVNLMTGSQKLLKLKCKEEKKQENKTRENFQELWENIKQCNILRMPGEERTEQEKYVNG